MQSHLSERYTVFAAVIATSVTMCSCGNMNVQPDGFIGRTIGMKSDPFTNSSYPKVRKSAFERAYKESHQTSSPNPFWVYLTGRHYYEGYGVTRDTMRGIQYLQAAEQLGSSEANDYLNKISLPE